MYRSFFLVLFLFSLNFQAQNLVSPVSRDADSIMQIAVNRSAQNNPQEILHRFSFTTYEKTLITDSIDVEGSAHSFFAEKVALNRYSKNYGFKEEVLGLNMAGFKEPRYEVLAITLQSRSFYDDDFVIFNYRYAGPISKRGVKNYDYTFLRDTIILDRPSFAIQLTPKRPQTIPGLSGIIWLDAETLAIQQVHINLKDELAATIEQAYTYFPDQHLYLPKSSKLYIEKGETSRRLAIFKGKISMGTIENNPVQEAIKGRHLFSTLVNSDFNFQPTNVIKHPNLAIEVMPDADSQTEEFWSQYRNESLSQKDLNSFTFLDDVVQAENIEKRLAVINNFGIGYYTVDFFDFDLTYPIKYNNYEGLRLGLGGITNSSFSKRFRMEGYTAYGFKDHTFKFGIGGGVLLNEEHGAWLSLTYNDDLQEVGSYNYLTDRRVYSLFEPRLVNISQFYDYRTIRSNLEFQITPKILSELQLSNVQIAQTAPYRFQNAGKIYRDYIMTEATLGVRWSPRSKFMRSSEGTAEVFDGYPKVTAQITKGISGVFNSDFDYTKLGAKVFYRVDRLNKSATEILIEGDAAFGDLPLSHLFHAYPNAPNKETVMQRFSVAGVNSFETMYFGEFFSDRLATVQVKHRLRPFNLGEKFKPEMVFITRYDIGDIRNPEDHLDVTFNSLKKGYTESGFEINKLLFGFGTSLTYRYGAYSLPDFADNLAFKFTFYLQL
ncbi:MAG: DUF5686 family protein [Leeuwenhoekiella sp.]